MRKTSAILLAAALPMAVQAANTEFTYGGYIKFDAAYSEYKDGDMAAAGIGRDFYVPSTIPTGGAEGTNSFDMNAKSSRFNLKAVTKLDNGETLTSFIEMDFLGSAQGNELATNAYSPRLRHAFFTYNNLTFGQTWSTFMNTAALPETVDFLGVSDGTVFVLQPQVRYTQGNLQVSLENPETGLSDASATGATPAAQDAARSSIAQDDNAMPDIVARYNIPAGDHSFSVAAIARQLSSQTSAGVDETATGFGANVAGIIKLGSDDLKFSVTHGQVSRYVGLAAVADAVVAAGDIEATTVTAAFVAYRHFWTPQLRSTVAYSMLEADYDDAAYDKLNKNMNSSRVNLMYSPTKEVTYGVEYSMASLEKEDGTEGDMNRLHFTARYNF